MKAWKRQGLVTTLSSRLYRFEKNIASEKALNFLYFVKLAKHELRRYHVRSLCVPEKTSIWKIPPEYSPLGSKRLCKECLIFSKPIYHLFPELKSILLQFLGKNRYNPLYLDLSLFEVRRLKQKFLKRLNRKLAVDLPACINCASFESFLRHKRIKKQDVSMYWAYFFFLFQFPNLRMKSSIRRKGKRLKKPTENQREILFFEHNTEKENVHPVNLDLKSRKRAEAFSRQATKVNYLAAFPWVNRTHLTVPSWIQHRLKIADAFLPTSSFLFRLWKRNFQLTKRFLREKLISKLNKGKESTSGKSFFGNKIETRRTNLEKTSILILYLTQRENAAFNIQKKIRKWYRNRVDKATVIQDLWRYFYFRKGLHEAGSAKKIQRVARKFLANIKVVKLRKLRNIISLQSAIKRFIFREKLREIRLAAKSNIITRAVKRKLFKRAIAGKVKVRAAAGRIQTFFSYKAKENKQRIKSTVKKEKEKKSQNLIYKKRDFLLNSLRDVQDERDLIYLKKHLTSSSRQCLDLNDLHQEIVRQRILFEKYERFMKFEQFELEFRKSILAKKLYRSESRLNSLNKKRKLLSLRLNVQASIFLESYSTRQFSLKQKKLYLVKKISRAIKIRNQCIKVFEYQLFVQQHWERWIKMVNEDLISNKFRCFLSCSKETIIELKKKLSNEIFTFGHFQTHANPLARKLQSVGAQFGVALSLRDCKEKINQIKDQLYRDNISKSLVYWILLEQEKASNTEENSLLRASAMKIKIHIIKQKNKFVGRGWTQN
eukprot:snap_masked-scaffold_3-processed-gene-5.22-mRNA-1 protein AED:1.00 eAED:1.00 QI:0/0/0/0/1/1/2/0/771